MYNEKQFHFLINFSNANFLSFESSNDDQLIESSENELAIRALQENKKYVFISGSNKSGKTSLAKRFSEKNKKN